jgi:protein Mpv17
MFFATLGVMRSESLDETMEEIRHKFIRLYKAEWIVWPTAQVINFWILPSRFRVLYDNTISLGYDVYTSYVINEPIPKPTVTLSTSSTNSPTSCSFQTNLNSS